MPVTSAPPRVRITAAATEAILRAVVRPRPAGSAAALCVLVGLPGAGKSTFAARLAATSGAVVLESDRLRHLLFGAPVFSAGESATLFRAIVGAARLLLEQGHAVIVDATNLSERDRRPFVRLSASAGVPMLLARLHAPEPVIEERLRRRLAHGHDCSYADIDVYHRMKGRVEPIEHKHWSVDTSDAVATEAALAAIAAALQKVAG